jgi:isocitrate dehydrogenase
VLATTLDAATGKLLLENKAPGHNVGELDNRGSHFYLAMFWAQALAEQTDDAELQAEFAPIAEQLTNNEQAIVDELASVQGQEVDFQGGYFMPDDALMNTIMRPSSTLNAIIS